MTPNPCLDAGNWKQYAVHAPDVPLFKLAEFEEHHVELKMDPVVQEMPVQSMITVPSAGDELKVEGTKVRRKGGRIGYMFFRARVPFKNGGG